jgi:lipopolysaccharide transport system permease protein
LSGDPGYSGISKSELRSLYFGFARRIIPPRYTTDLMEELVIKAGRAERQYWRDLWKYRELFYFLAWRDLLVRYKQTVVGIAWSVIRPFLTMIVLTIIFGKIGRMPSGGVPYALLVLAGMLPWQFFANALSESGNSLVANSNLISKVYFPRLIVPASSVITSFVDFLLSAVFLVGVMFWYHFAPPATILLLPLFIALAFAASFGVGLWFAALMVEYRDFRFIVPFVVQFGLYVSPVGFLSSVITERYGENYRLLYSLNPIVGVIDGFRWCVLGGQNTLYWPGLLMSVLGTGLMLTTGIWYFRHTERTFADVI